jgi:hypothetical protein
MFMLPVEIQNNIQDYADISGYWKNIFSNQILKYINQGWRLTGIMNVACHQCFENGHEEPNTNCENCFIQFPCINCYWYNTFDSQYMQNCLLCTHHEMINWNQIKNFMNDDTIPETYEDFLKSDEWKKTLLEFEKNKIEIAEISEFYDQLFDIEME